jgi:hypothetical protein
MKGKPPVPPENRSQKGPGSDPEPAGSKLRPEKSRENSSEQGDSANTRQNTTVQGSHGHRQR